MSLSRRTSSLWLSKQTKTNSKPFKLFEKCSGKLIQHQLSFFAGIFDLHLVDLKASL
jgi:hypothetical protein